MKFSTFYGETETTGSSSFFFVLRRKSNSVCVCVRKGGREEVENFGKRRRRAQKHNFMHRAAKVERREHFSLSVLLFLRQTRGCA